MGLLLNQAGIQKLSQMSRVATIWTVPVLPLVYLMQFQDLKPTHDQENVLQKAK